MGLASTIGKRIAAWVRAAFVGKKQVDVAEAELQLSKLKRLKSDIKIFYKDYIKPQSSDPMEEILLPPRRARRAAEKAGEIFAEIREIKRVIAVSSERLEGMISKISKFTPSVGNKFKKDLRLEGMLKTNVLNLEEVFRRAVNHMAKERERGHITSFFDIAEKLLDEEIAIAKEELEDMRNAAAKAA